LYGLLLAADFGLTGAFLARNALLFVLAFEITLIPTTLLLAIWGGERRATAAIRYLIVWGRFRCKPCSRGVLALGLLNTNGFQLCLRRCWPRLSLPPAPSAGSWACCCWPSGLKMPVLPLHGWQPLAYSQASTPVAMQLSGVGLQARGLWPAAFCRRDDGRHLGRLGPGHRPCWAWCRRCTAPSMPLPRPTCAGLVAYSSLGHMGLLMLAISAASPLSLQGAMAQILAHGLITSLLFCLVGMIETRTGTTEIAGLSGLLNPCRGLAFHQRPVPVGPDGFSRGAWPGRFCG